MRLRTKLSLVLALCIVLYSLSTTYVLSRFFASEQRAYLNDLQTSLALAFKNQLEMRFSLLYTQVEALTSSESFHLRELVQKVSGALGGELWEGGLLKQTMPFRKGNFRPDSLPTRWTLAPSPWDSVPALRWIGRFGKRIVAIDLRIDWVREGLQTSHGAIAQLVLKDGTVLFRSDAESNLIRGSEYFHNPHLVKRFFVPENPGVHTRPYVSADGTSYLGTFLAFGPEQRMLIVIATPWAQIDSILTRTFKESACITSVFVILAIIVGALFAGTLTAPLRQLVSHAREVAKGNLERNVGLCQRRKDEVGVLARAIQTMTRELYRTRQKLRRNERLAALRRFSAAIAHEIRNPLSSILSSAQVAEMKLAPHSTDVESAKRSLTIAKDQAQRASYLIQRLMKFAKQERRPETRVLLGETLDSFSTVIHPVLDRFGITLELKTPTQPIPCIADPEKLQEVLTNLVQNAVHALREATDKRICISLCTENNQAVLKVRDNGHGIGPELRDHLFEPFFTTKAPGEGNGLGLAVCHGIIASHRGTIDVTSEPGQGTEFTIRLPLLTKEGKPSEGQREAA